MKFFFDLIPDSVKNAVISQVFVAYFPYTKKSAHLILRFSFLSIKCTDFFVA